jgi:hypothetical protein
MPETTDTDDLTTDTDDMTRGTVDTTRGAEVQPAGQEQERPYDPSDGDGAPVALTSDPEALRRQWDSVQVGFVDDPRQAVGEADALVTSAIDDLVAGFRHQRERLEAAWSNGNEASTDDLRDAFRLYRDFFERLLRV